MSPDASRWERWGIALIVVVGLALRFFRLDFQSLWIDEVLTARTSAHSIAELLFDAGIDQNVPPLHASIVHGVSQLLGPSDAVIRLPSAVAGILSVPLLYVVARRLLGGSVALVAAGLLALSPLHVWYSQEARPYALLLFCGLLAVWFAHRIVSGEKGWGLTAGLVLSTTAACYLHLVAAPLAVLVGGYLLLTAPPGERTARLLPSVAIGVLLLPLAYRMLSVPPDVSGNTDYRFSITHLGYTLWAFVAGFSLGPSLTELRQGMRAVIPALWLMVPVLGMALGLTVYGGALVRRRDKKIFRLLVAWLVLPMAFAVYGAAVTVHPYNVRYVLLSLPALLILLAAGLAGLPARGARWAVQGLAVVVCAVALWNYYTVPEYQRENGRAATRYLEAQADPGDLVIVSAPYSAAVLGYYATRADLQVRPYPESGYVEPGALPGDLSRLLGERERVWVFLSRTFHSDPAGDIERYMDAHLSRAGEFTAAGVRVLRYTRQPS